MGRERERRREEREEGGGEERKRGETGEEMGRDRGRWGDTEGPKFRDSLWTGYFTTK